MSSSEEESDHDAEEFFAAQALKEDLDAADEKKVEPKKFINNKEGLLNKLKEISLPPHFGWIEKLDVTSPHPLALDDINDDPAREKAFYQVTVHGAKQALIQFEQGQIPFQRPVDYYAEMVKPDEHMAKIKDILGREKKKMDLVQERKKQREYKKVAKQIQADKQKERAKQKKETLEKIDSLRKKGKNSNAREIQNNDVDLALDEKAQGGKAEKGEKRKAGSQKKGKSKKRKLKDQKFGYGGPKKDKKKNTAGSSGSMKSFSLGKNRKLWKGFAADKKSGKGGQVGGKKKGGKGKRPGKMARQQKRTQK